jgi:hypothetical protein
LSGRCGGDGLLERVARLASEECGFFETVDEDLTLIGGVR